MSYVGRFGDTYFAVGAKIGEGGEGAVYHVQGKPGYVMKILHENERGNTRHNKLVAMLDASISTSVRSQVAWPVDILYENNSFVGYIMPLVKDKETFAVINSSKYSFTLAEKILIGKNLCAAVNSIHSIGQVIGDLNPNNICVNPKTARVTLIDTDSYHIRDKNNCIYRCEVGMAEYLPREIQEKIVKGYTLRNMQLPTYTKETDLFSLAVLLYILLMNGANPFACALGPKATGKQVSDGAPQPKENILSGFVPFYSCQKGLTTPIYSPDFKMLPERIRNLFIRAFVDGHNDPKSRPSSSEWFKLLDEMGKNLSECKNVKGHIYPKHLKKCPWCELDNKLKKEYLTSSSGADNKTESLNRKNAIPNLSRKYNLAEEKRFWILTFFISAGIMAVAYMTFGENLILYIYGEDYKSGVDGFGLNLMPTLGSWGFAISGFIGWMMFNSHSGSTGRRRKWYSYLASISVAEVSAVLWVLFAYIISIVTMILGCLFIIGIIMLFIELFG